MPKNSLALISVGLSASALALLPWAWLLPLLLASGGLLLLLHWPWLSWLGLAVTLPVLSGIKFNGLSLTEVALVALALLWFADGVRRRSLPLHTSVFLLGPLVYGSALYLAAFQAANLGEAATEVVKWLEFTAVILLVRSSLSAQQRPWLVLALLAAGVGQALFGLYQFVFRIGPDWFMILGQFMRASGSFSQPNPFGGYLGLTLPVAISLALWAWARLGQQLRQCLQPNASPGGVESSRLTTLIWAVVSSAAAGVLAAGLFASWSRGAWLGAGLAGIVVLVVRSRRSLVASGMALLVLLVTMLLGAFQPNMVPAAIAQRVQDLPAYLGFSDVLSQPVTDENFAVIERVAHWVAAWRMWERSPWLGIGPGNYAAVYPVVRLPRWEEPLGHAHNIYLNVLAESGVVGLLAFGLFWGGMVWWVIRHIRGAGPVDAGWNKALAIGVLGVLVHLGVHNFFDNLFVQGIYLHVALWFGALSIDRS